MTPASNTVNGRIALVHALTESIQPIEIAFQKYWPQADRFNVLDDALSRDRTRSASLNGPITERVLKLIDYAIKIDGQAPPTLAVVFTGSAFGPALQRARARIDVPILSPNEAAFREASTTGGSIALLVTFRPSLELLAEELRVAIQSAGSGASVDVHFVEGALSALQAGREQEHDQLIVSAAERCSADRILLGQYSMARASDAVEARTGKPVLTTPASTIIELRNRLEHQ